MNPLIKSTTLFLVYLLLSVVSGHQALFGVAVHKNGIRDIV